MSEVEIPLPGGQVGGAVRVGDTVRRPTGPWTPAVHELLDFLADAHLPLVPRVHGLDDRGREILDYLPGRVLDVDTEVLSDAQLTSAIRWLRQYHDTVAGLPPLARRWRFTDRAPGPGEIICHHDFAAYNLAFDGDELAGVFDWDVAGPGTPLDDLAMFAWNGPLVAAREPARAPSDDDVAERAAHGLRLMSETYGGVTPHAILAHVTTRMSAAADRIEAGQRAGDPGMVQLGLAGEPAATRARIQRIVSRLPALAAALGPSSSPHPDARPPAGSPSRRPPAGRSARPG